MNLVIFLAILGLLELERWQGFVYNWVYIYNLLWFTQPLTLVLLGIGLTFTLRLKRPYRGYASIGIAMAALPPVDLWIASVGSTYGFNLLYFFALSSLILLIGNRNEKLKTYFVTAGHGFFLLFLATGIASFFNQSGDAYTFLKTQHASLSFTYAPFVFLSAMEHSRTSAAGVTKTHRAASFVALAAMSGLFVTGFARLSSGGGSASISTQTFAHAIFFGLFLALTIAHILAAIPRIKKAQSPAHQKKRYPLAGGVFFVITLASAPYFFSKNSPPNPQDKRAPNAAQHKAEEEPHSFDVISISSRQNSCAMVGCHIQAHGDATRQWTHSAHQQSANPFYLRVLDEPGGQEARAAICSRCHEPLLSSVDATDKDAMERAQSEGVSCGVCHFMTANSTPNPGNGNYQLAVDREYRAKIRMPSTKVMIVYDDKDTHRAETLPEEIADSETCGVCHELVLNGLQLRATYSEWKNSNYAKKGSENFRSCVHCHMPNTPTYYSAVYPDKATHDHRFLGANLMITGGKPELRAMKIAFISAALDLSFEPIPDTENNILALRINLKNSGGGHGFPAAPLDLVEYWYEWRVDEAPWTRLHKTPIFHETLFDDAGNELDFHQIWRAASRTGGERVLPGATRTETLDLPYKITAASAQTLELRLMHRRLRPGMGERVKERADLFLEAVEIIRSPTPPNGS